MQNFTDLSRRRFIAQTGIGMLAFASAPAWLWAMEGMKPTPKMAPNKASQDFNPDVEIELVCRRAAVPILSGQQTQVLQYVGRLMKGPNHALTTIPASYLGPLMRFKTGQKVRIHLRNELDEPTITHWHGLNVPALMDGHPMYAIDKGETFVYEFEVKNRASMILYHPHTHGMTGRQVYQGLAGAMLINDAEEEALGLPSGEYEVPIVIQDRLFDQQNQFVYVRNMHDRMMGMHGDHILVNGQADYSIDVASRAYRLRVLNGSNARIYKLAWDDGSPMVVIGVDGGLLEAPVHKPYVMLAPGERIDVWADFSGRSVGTQLVMRSRPFTGALPKMAERMMGMMSGGGMMGGMDHGGSEKKPQEGDHNMGGMGMMGGGGMMGGMDRGGEKKSQEGGHGMGGGMGGMMGGGMDHGGGEKKPQEGGHGMGGGMMGGMHGMMGNKLPMGSDYPIFTVRVTRAASESPNLPTHLSKITRYRLDDVANSDKPTPIGISEAPMAMLINGRPYAYNDVQPNERIPFDSLRLVEIFHAHGGEGGHGAGAAKPAEGGGMGGMMGMMGGGGMDRGGGEKKPQEGGHNMGGGMGMMGGGMMGGGMMGGGMMMSMAHPIHLHEQPFQILSRTIGAEEAEDYATVRDGFIDSGWKDTVLIMPGEKIRIIKPFKDHKGLFMVHCHNLEHEDMGMMREFLVE
jgi:FtsP/CotA-like multicopper oxidase with cupredoxin domain